MNTKTLSNRALSVIDQYVHFKVGGAVTKVPYFNNKSVAARATLRTFIGKGSPQDIFEEVTGIAVKNHIPIATFADESLKQFLVEKNIGIDCSGFVYYVLNAESQELGKGPIDKHLSFVKCTGLVGKIRCSLRPVENCDVATFAHDKNSSVVRIADAKPGDIITMVGSNADQGISGERDHILVIHQIEYQNFIPTKIHYTHAVAYPEDGTLGTGPREGEITIVDPNRPLTEAIWTENGTTGSANRLFNRALNSRTELRRMNWM